MGWTTEQRDELAREFGRVGIRAGDQLPTLRGPAGAPDEYLALVRSIPDGAGLAGFLDALPRRVPHRLWWRFW